VVVDFAGRFHQLPHHSPQVGPIQRKRCSELTGQCHHQLVRDRHRDYRKENDQTNVCKVISDYSVRWFKRYNFLKLRKTSGLIFLLFFLYQ
jgi:hypothetical protein